MTRAEKKKRSADLTQRVAVLLDHLDGCWSISGAECNLKRLLALQPEIRAVQSEIEKSRLGK